MEALETKEDVVEGGVSTLARDPELRRALQEAAKYQRASAKADAAWQEAMSGFITGMAAPGSIAVDVRKAMAVSEHPDAHREYLEARAESKVANQCVSALLVLRGRPAIHLLEGLGDDGDSA